jgi:glycerol-3-phosphate acyltransferase PlsY
MNPFLIIAIAYALGSIPFGYLIVQALAGADIRESGSGGTGATNVSRRAGKPAGLITLILDVLKGAFGVLLARWFTPGEELGWTVAVTGIAVVVGHIFPIWLGFRGGKGVATAVGVFLVLAPLNLVVAGLVFFCTILLTRYVSLASILASVSLLLFTWLQRQFGATYYRGDMILISAVVIAILIIFAHRANIGRLIRGTENRFR